MYIAVIPNRNSSDKDTGSDVLPETFEALGRDGAVGAVLFTNKYSVSLSP